MKPAPIRAFIAVELPADVQAQLDSVIQRLRAARAAAVRWVPVSNIHLTLKFLGDSDPADLTRLGGLLEGIAARCRPAELVVGGLGCFPNNRQPRVIWVGMQIPPQIKEMQQSTEAAAQRIGYAREERPFSPHLTLGRVQKNASREEVAQIAGALSAVTVGELGRFEAGGITLFRSDLRPTGSIYTPLGHFPFSG